MTIRPLEIDMCAGSQLRDTQGETLNVEGADIGELMAGRGRLNDNHGKGFFNCIGKVTSAKKIFKREECEDDRQRYYWDKVKSPYIYVRGELFNDEDHPNAKAAAAILRNIHKSDCPLKIKASVEGGVVARGTRDHSLLAKTKIHSVALTFVPANQATLVEPLSLDKSSTDTEADMVLIKSVLHLAQTTVPSFRQITRDASASKIEQNLNKIFELMGEEGVELKKALVEESLELKIAENVEKINKLVKIEKLNKAYGIRPSRYSYAKQAMANNNSGFAQALRIIIRTAKHGKPPKQLELPLDDKEKPSEGLKKKILDPSFGYKFSHEHHDLGDGKQLTRINVHTPEGEHVGAATFLHQGQNLVPGHVVVDDNHQRRGIASAMYNHAMKHTGKTVIPSSNQTQEGAALWSGTKGVFKTEKELNKTLSAGYGGAGSPTSLTGGGVIQGESFGPKSFKYIVCDNCGKEQIYGKYQVKCRECSKAFPLAKLEKFFKANKG